MLSLLMPVIFFTSFFDIAKFWINFIILQGVQKGEKDGEARNARCWSVFGTKTVKIGKLYTYFISIGKAAKAQALIYATKNTIQ